MDFIFLGTMPDPAKCSKLSMEEKRELVYEMSKHPQSTPEMLQSWSRQEILQLLCAEMGKERKYTGLTKLKMIENLLKIVSEKNSRESGAKAAERNISNCVDIRAPKDQRKPDHFPRLTAPSGSVSWNNGITDLFPVIYCKNSACKASLSPQDMFCKRCSCCICKKFDDNKDPSLWLTCSSEPPFEGVPCNMSCHLDCALQHERSGLSKMGQVSQLDGSFYCVSCGKMNDLLKCWKKQLMIARDTRRVDILCYRISLGQKLLSGTNKYPKLSDIVEEAVQKLQAEAGPLTNITVTMGRGIVNRMSSGQEVQRLCAYAVELLDSALSELAAQPLTHHIGQDSLTSEAKAFRVEDICATSVTVILGPSRITPNCDVCYTLWHRKAVDEEVTCEQACTFSPPGTRVAVQGLAPFTEYIFKVVTFVSFQETSTYEARISTTGSVEEITLKAALEISHSPVTNCSTLSNPSSVEDEMNITSVLNENNKVDNYFKSCKKKSESMIHMKSMDVPIVSVGGILQGRVSASDEKHAPNDVVSNQSGEVKHENKHSQECQVNEENGLSTPIKTQLETVPCPSPCQIYNLENVRRLRRSKLRKKGVTDKFWNGGDQPQEPQPSSSSKKRGRASQEGNADLEYYVKVIRRLECDGHIEKSFRQRFLTWYSLKATPREMHVVQVFVSAFKDDPTSLAEQLIDAFEENVSGKSSEAQIPSGLCMKLWH